MGKKERKYLVFSLEVVAAIIGIAKTIKDLIKKDGKEKSKEAVEAKE